MVPCVFSTETKILSTGSIIFSFRTLRITEKVDVSIFHFRLKVHHQTKNRRRHLSIFFQDVLLMFIVLQQKK